MPYNMTHNTRVPSYKHHVRRGCSAAARIAAFAVATTVRVLLDTSRNTAEPFMTATYA